MRERDEVCINIGSFRVTGLLLPEARYTKKSNSTYAMRLSHQMVWNLRKHFCGHIRCLPMPGGLKNS
jgi:hypothetical protein